MKRYLILDCYVDEPACLGVPPFISPYPRYIYGALIDGGADESAIDYLTIDHLRERDYKIEKDYYKVFLIGGAVVPGRYLGAKIGTLSEIKRILTENKRQDIAAGGLINRALGTGEFDIDVIDNDLEKYAWSLASGDPEDSPRSIDEISRWSVLGASVVKMHPWFPNVICEIETGRGCPRLTHCSFCSEGLYKNIEFRREDQILREVDTLTSNGVTRFRIGRQADIIQYMTPFNEFNGDFPKPNVDAVKSLFGELKDRKDSGSIEVLNIDNGNPGSIVCWPDESSRALEAIADAVTEGDTLPFGIESFDPAVVKANRLKVLPDEALFAVKLLNEVGGDRRNGIPKLLPGINLIHGLKDETTETFRINYEYLKRMADEGYLIKRINIRKLMPYPGTALYEKKPKIKGKLTGRFEYYRDRIRNEIDRAMLRSIYPSGTILENNMMGLQSKARCPRCAQAPAGPRCFRPW